jgi:hypothetical protein
MDTSAVVYQDSKETVTIANVKIIFNLKWWNFFNFYFYLSTTAICERPCENGGRCVAPGQCSCRRGFYGAQCELDVDECTTGQHECNANSECRNMPGWYACTCRPGFRSPLADTQRGALCRGNNLVASRNLLSLLCVLAST